MGADVIHLRHSTRKPTLTRWRSDYSNRLCHICQGSKEYVEGTVKFSCYRIYLAYPQHICQSVTGSNCRHKLTGQYRKELCYHPPLTVVSPCMERKVEVLSLTRESLLSSICGLDTSPFNVHWTCSNEYTTWSRNFLFVVEEMVFFVSSAVNSGPSRIQTS